MKKILAILIFLSVPLTLFGVEVQMNLLKDESPGSNTKVPAGNEQAFKDGELFYNAMPSTPAVGSAIKVIETTDDTDFICKDYQLKTKDIGYEIKQIITKTLKMENGSVCCFLNTETGFQSLVVTAPIFQFPFIEAVINTYDRLGTAYAKSGSKRLVYITKYRKASELRDIIVDTLASPYGDVIIDDTINTIMIKDAPSVITRCEKYIPLWDVPPSMVRIEAEIIEIENGENFNFGLALEAWKEALPEEVNMDIDWDEDKTGGGGGPSGWGRSIAQSVRINGMRPKAMANFINYLVKTGNAKVLSRPTIVALNNQEGRIISQDTVSYVSYTEPDEPLHKQTEIGLELKIKPTITLNSINLDIQAIINSLVGYSGSGEPMINKRATTANVLIEDGELFTLSGLKKDTITKSNSGVPILQNIPFLGYFFRHEIDVKSTKEIVVFLTPKKVTPRTSVMKKECELISNTRYEVAKPAGAPIKKFVDRVILNKTD